MKQILSQQLNWDDFLSLYEVAHEAQLSVSLMVFPRFVVFCEVLLDRPTVTWNLVFL